MHCPCHHIVTVDAIMMGQSCICVGACSCDDHCEWLQQSSPPGVPTCTCGLRCTLCRHIHHSIIPEGMTKLSIAFSAAILATIRTLRTTSHKTSAQHYRGMGVSLSPSPSPPRVRSQIQPTQTDIMPYHLHGACAAPASTPASTPTLA